ncbi:pentapeptide repeat-containing protein [Streptomyces sp. NPDC059398]|uniref:pentapeptide repeat-containing protein n=1 Tax=Streptomyces sp. NPDC059398 TaxID=3346820 RepID=UPI0036A64710
MCRGTRARAARPVPLSAGSEHSLFYLRWFCWLRGARLRGARLRGARLRGMRVRGMRVRGMRVCGAWVALVQGVGHQGRHVLPFETLRPRPRQPLREFGTQR